MRDPNAKGFAFCWNKGDNIYPISPEKCHYKGKMHGLLNEVLFQIAESHHILGLGYLKNGSGCCLFGTHF